MFDQLFTHTGLSLERLRNFCKVAELESFTQAADSDSNRQTLYSRQIKELETYFGTELFRRKGRTVELTEDGRRLYTLVSEYFSAIEDFAESCATDMQTFVIGAGDSLIQWLILPNLKDIRLAAYNAELSCKNMRTQEIVEGLSNGTVDFGFTRKDAIDGSFEHIGLGKLKFGLFYPVNTDEGLKHDIDYLTNLTFAGMEGGGAFQRQFEMIAVKHGIILKKAVNCSSYPMMAKAVKSLGIAAILPMIASEEFPENRFKYRDMIMLDNFERDMVICWHSRKGRLNPSIPEIAKKMGKILRLN